MKLNHHYLIVITLSCLSLEARAAAPKAPANDPQRAERLVKEIDELWRGASSKSVASMRVKTAHYDRKLEINAFSKGLKRTLIRIVAPKSEEGMATLRSESEMHSYLPKTDRTIRLTSGMMMSPWMGSHFTNDDLAKASSLYEDYNKKITFEGQSEGENIVELTLTPKPNAPVVWAKLVITTRQSDNMPLRQDYYDEDMKPVRSLYLSNVKVLGGRKLPTVLTMVPADKPNEMTQLVYQQLEFDVPYDDSFFSLLQLRRR